VRLARSPALARCALALALIAASVATAAADGVDHPRHHYRHYIPYGRAAYAEPIPYYGECRLGWWQGLRYGHVQPHWGGWCR